jgi:hypothetical protein
LWQVTQVPGATAVWLKVAGSQAVVRWHWSQEAVVWMWLAGLPRAVVPLWQVTQVPGATVAWLKPAGSQAVVRWQVSHDDVVMTWFGGLPLACAPLWQVAQVPGATPVWRNRAPAQVTVELWHCAQGSAVGMWLLGLAVVARPLPGAWQSWHWRGVPLNTPKLWQLSHVAWLWAPVSGKPVRV